MFVYVQTDPFFLEKVLLKLARDTHLVIIKDMGIFNGASLVEVLKYGEESGKCNCSRSFRGGRRLYVHGPSL